MKVLYAIQGTGNGHLSRARAVIPILKSHKIDLDILVSGIQADVTLPYAIKYKYHGLSFIFGKKGGVNLWATLSNTKPFQLWNEIKNLPITHYDLVINDFEPVSAWAAKINNVPCVSFSHQAAVMHKNAPKPKDKHFLGAFILNNYAPTKKQIGLHFSAYGNEIYSPIIRNEIRDAISSNKGHYTVYLPSYSNEKIIAVLSCFPEITWHVFSKHCKTITNANDHIHIQPIDNDAFIESLVSCEGMLCGAGFETPAEVLFLKKKLMVIPMSGQYEQQCNAAALKKMGVTVSPQFNKKAIPIIKSWLKNQENIVVDYKDEVNTIVNEILDWGMMQKSKRTT